MGGVRGQARAVPDREDRRGAAVLHVGWRQIAPVAVMVRVVGPREQIAADGARVSLPSPPLLKQVFLAQPARYNDEAKL